MRTIIIPWGVFNDSSYNPSDTAYRYYVHKWGAFDHSDSIQPADSALDDILATISNYPAVIPFMSISDAHTPVPAYHCTSAELHLCNTKKALPDVFTIPADDQPSDTKGPPSNLSNFSKDDTSGFDKNNMMTATCPISVSAARNTNSLV